MDPRTYQDLLLHAFATQQQDAEAAAWQQRVGADYAYTGDARQQWESNQAEAQYRQQWEQQVAQWMATRPEYRAQIAQAYEASARPGIEQARRDDSRGNALAMAGRGMRQSSEDFAGQADTQQRYAQALANMALQREGMVQAQESADFDFARALRELQYAKPGDAAMAQARLGQLQNALSGYSTMTAANNQFNQIQQANSVYQQQLKNDAQASIGQLLQTAATTAGRQGWFANQPTQPQQQPTPTSPQVRGLYAARPNQ